MIVQTTPVDVSQELVDQVRQFPTSRIVTHCGRSFSVPPFAIYAVCPHCEKRIKVRAFSANPEVEDLFDAVCEWLEKPGANEILAARQAELREES